MSNEQNPQHGSTPGRERRAHKTGRTHPRSESRREQHSPDIPARNTNGQGTGKRHARKQAPGRRRAPEQRTRRESQGRRGMRASRPAPKPFTPEQIGARRASVPAISYPPLPVSERREEIARAIASNQVVIVAGETGSGKTTQLPKICLELGRGIAGLIGHTQPRRIAARSVAQRISDELGVEPGTAIGYQVRFTDETSPATLVKLMTDGILLAEIQSDPLLTRYDTLIVDEAHERSLNIDFLLGYLARLLPRRPDLKLIVTSATIDTERFAKHFGPRMAGGRPGASAPVIEVSGRTYPVEIRYRPLAGEGHAGGAAGGLRGGSESPQPSMRGDAGPRTPRRAETSGLADTPQSRNGQARRNSASRETAGTRSTPAPGATPATPGRAEAVDQVTGILEAADELMSEGPGDILVFLSGEGEIRDVHAAFAHELAERCIEPGGRSNIPNAVEVLPLFARLSAAEQQRIFAAHSHRRIILATNIAETSLTVPGIRYVIDAGTARISRYSSKTKVQRLPIEPVSQASANQRAGRCGRVADGICIRLYSEEDFAAREEFTQPEIQRTSLASVILQMVSLGLGEIAEFPFIDPPDSRAVRAGMQLLEEIGAIETGARGRGRSKDGRGVFGDDSPANAPSAHPGNGSSNNRAATPGNTPSNRSPATATASATTNASPHAPAQRSPERHGPARVAHHDTPRQGTPQHAPEASPASPHAKTQERTVPSPRLTRIGWQLARLPIDPRLGRMLIEARRNGCASEVLVLVAALSVQDVRERPAEKRPQADQLHARFTASSSDFLAYLTLWRYLRTQARDLSGSAFRRMCRGEFLNYLRYREWADVVRQLEQMARPLGLDTRPLAIPTPEQVRAAGRETDQRLGAVPSSAAAALACRELGRSADTPSADAIHKSLLVGLLSNLGAYRQRTRDFEGARGTHFVIWPGSGLHRRTPDWVMAAELVETSRLFARTVAAIDGDWIERAAGGLVKRSYSEPYWSRRMGAAMCREKVTLYGMVLVADREVLAVKAGTPRARETAREMFIENALVGGDWRERPEFLARNAAALEEARETERRLRTHGLVADERRLFAFYDERVGEQVVSAGHFNSWWKKELAGGRGDLLDFTQDFLLGSAHAGEAEFPSVWRQGEFEFDVSYAFDPGGNGDGVTVEIPVTVLGEVRPEGFDWLVPGMRGELVLGTIRALPKRVRRDLVPAPDVARELEPIISRLERSVREDGAAHLPFGDGPQTGDSSVSGTGLRFGDGPQTGGSSAPGTSKPTPQAESSFATQAKARLRGDALDALALALATEEEKAVQAARDSAAPIAMNGTASGPGNATGTGARIHRREPDSNTTRGNARPDPAPQTDAGAGTASPQKTGLSFREAFTQAVWQARGIRLADEDWADAHVPSHLRMHFRVRSERGAVLDESDSLERLQASLAPQRAKAVKSVVRGAVARALDEAHAEIAERERAAAKARAEAEATAAGLAEGLEASLGVPVKPGEELGGFPQAAIPASVQTQGARGPVHGFPALVLAAGGPMRHSGTPRNADRARNADRVRGAGPGRGCVPSVERRVSLEILPSAGEQAFAHAQAVCELAYRRLRLDPARVSSRWTGAEALALAGAPYPGTDLLVADLQRLGARTACEAWALEAGVALGEVRRPEDFEALCAWARDRFEDDVYSAARLAAKICGELAEARRAVEGTRSLALVAAVADEKEHLGELAGPGFLGCVPLGRLAHFPRYLRAVRMRLEKAAGNPGGDDAAAWQVRQARALVEDAARDAAGVPFDAACAARVERARWMVEELRVSLFAQQLGTAEKVSVKRIAKALE